MSDSESRNAQPQRVIVTDFDMSFGNMITFMVKLAIAAIPAALILAMLGFFVFAVLGGLITK